jgi:glycosyltransferase involved in cell wall biosynthesis
MTHPPLVSIGVPVYNGEHCIKNALESLVTQSYQNLEIIISDNASTDRTPEICREFAARDQRVRYHRNDSNIGLIPNFHNVLNLATGEFFMWACADDVRPRIAVEELVFALVKNREAVMAHGPVISKALNLEAEFSNEMDLSDACAAKRVRVFITKMQHNAMEYGLHRRAKLEKAVSVYGNHYGMDYLLSLQMCLFGPVTYIRTAMIIFSERTALSAPDPMGAERPMKLLALLKNSTRYKCPKVLLLGLYFLLSAEGVCLKERIAASSVFLRTFGMRYHRQLAKDALFLFCWPLARLCSLSWRLSRQVPGISRLGERVKAVLTRA